MICPTSVKVFFLLSHISQWKPDSRSFRLDWEPYSFVTIHKPTSANLLARAILRHHENYIHSFFDKNANLIFIFLLITPPPVTKHPQHLLTSSSFDTPDPTAIAPSARFSLKAQNTRSPSTPTDTMVWFTASTAMPDTAPECPCQPPFAPALTLAAAASVAAV